MLTPGTRIAGYEVVAPLGSGGMGEVYRARDAALQRDVAIKVLPDDFAEDADRVARFEREARTLATLNHPHIAHVYGLETAGAQRALVMELVEGPTLAERLAAGPLPLDEALPIARQIAEAVEAAHAQGIVHRDLKPANVKVRGDGSVKVLDFGLAKAVTARAAAASGRGEESPTMTSPVMTQQGMLLGTAAYMAPEQAKGRPVDTRVDVWAFGCVLYEMLTARRAFPGDDVTETLAAVIRAQPEWSALPSSTPPSIRRLLRRCLAKEPRLRLADLGVARLEIDEAGDGPEVPAGAIKPVSPARWRWAAAAFISGSMITALALWMLARAPAAPPMHLAIPLPDTVRWAGSNGTGLAISPDASHVAFLADVPGSADQQLFVRALGADNVSPVADSAGASNPFFSPDGRQVGFMRGGRLWRVAVSGGAAFEIGAIDPLDRGMAWAADGYVYSGGGSGLSRIRDTGGARESLTTVDRAGGEVAHRFPAVVPGRDAVVFTVFKGSLDEARLGVLDLRLRTPRILLDRPGHFPRVLPGRLVFLDRGTLLSVAFDPDTLTVTGEPENLLTRVLFNAGGAAHYDISQTGTVVYVSSAHAFPLTTPRWVARSGSLTAADEPLPPEGAYSRLALSPDGRQVALLDQPQFRDGATAISIWDLARRTFAARLQSTGLAESPVWHADGRSLFFTYRPEGVGSPGAIYRQRADGSESATPIGDDPIVQRSGSSGRFPASVSRDGTRLFHSGLGANDIEVFDLARSTSQNVTPGRDPQISPDGRWLAYVATGADGPEVLVRPYPDVDRARWLVSVGGGDQPRWSHDGRDLFYRQQRQIMAAAVETSRDFSPRPPRPVFDSAQPVVDYTVHPDGRRLLVLSVSTAATPVPRVILNCCRTPD